MNTFNLTEFRHKLQEALGDRELSHNSIVLLHTDYVKSGKTFNQWIGKEQQRLSNAFVIYDQKGQPLVYVVKTFTDEFTPQEMSALMELFNGSDNAETYVVLNEIS